MRKRQSLNLFRLKKNTLFSFIITLILSISSILFVAGISPNHLYGKTNNESHSSTKHATGDNSTLKKNTFRIHTDGRVTIDGLEFENFTQYVRSDYFRKTGKRCNTKTPPRQTQTGADVPPGEAGDCTLALTVIQFEYWPAVNYTIPIVFHVIYNREGTGNVSDDAIEAQVAVLNEDYRAIAHTLGENGFDTKIQFQLAGISRTENDSWHLDNDRPTYMAQLEWDPLHYLNVYVVNTGGYLGETMYFPQESGAGGTGDGIVLLYETVGGRDMGYPDYDQGRTLVHEIGHYLGLYHTFQDGCFNGYEAGDLIADTNSEETAHYDCIQTSTCGTEDPIHNYMNYTIDTCMNEFTSEQGNRMICSLLNYRPDLPMDTSPTITVTSPNGGESWSAGSQQEITWTSTGRVGNVKIEYSADNGTRWTTITSSSPNDGIETWRLPNIQSENCRVQISEADDGTPSDMSDNVFSIGTPQLSLPRNQLIFAAIQNGAHTDAQTVYVENIGAGTLNWSASSDASWLKISPSSSLGAGPLKVSVDTAGMALGQYAGSITVTDTDAVNSQKTISVQLTIKDASQSQAPFGVFSTPGDGETVRSSIPVTGWVLDDIGIASVKIYQGSYFVGDAVLVDGARPDVEAAHPGFPANYKAGWGYMLLTYFLPGGDGIHPLTVVATDVEGNQTILGERQIIVDNANAVKPFGAIDTPGQGGMASGNHYTNWGWVLAPQPYVMAIDGSGIDVWVDGVYQGHPTYDIYRQDIFTLFPGYANSNGAVGLFDLDTTAFANGVHNIYWTATDSAGHRDGIGSRYFTVFNGHGSIATTAGKGNESGSFDPAVATASPVWKGPVTVQKGFAKDGHTDPANMTTMYPGENGVVVVRMEPLDRVEIRLGKKAEQIQMTYAAFQLKGKGLRNLPTGSSFDKKRGIFYWHPGPGFLGSFNFLFLRTDGTGKTTKQQVTVNITVPE